MKLSDVPTTRLVEMLEATRRLLGDEAVEVRILRREIERRDWEAGRVASQPSGRREVRE